MLRMYTPRLINGASSKKQQLLEDYKEVNDVIRSIESNFNQVTDHDLVDYYIMRLKAEENRRTYILKQIRGE